MPVRLPYLPVPLSPAAAVLFSYWGANGYHRPYCTVYLVGPTGQVAIVPNVLIDTGSDYTGFDSGLTTVLGIGPPYRRSAHPSTGGGQAAIDFPDDGVVAVFVTDYREFFYLTAPLIGFCQQPTGHNVLGMNGFLRYFSLQIVNDGINRPEVVLSENARFAGRCGPLPHPLPALRDFLRQLRGVP